MQWIIFALLSGFGIASADAVTKYSFSKTDAISVMFVRLLAVVPFTLFFLPWVEIPNQIEPGFFLCVGALFPLDLFAFFLYLRAIKIAPLSLTIPYLALTPSFLLATGFLMLGERPNVTSGLGVILTTFGAFMLHVNAPSGGDSGAMGSSSKGTGSLTMIFVALLFSVTSALGKIAVSYTNPLFFAVAYIWFLAGVMALVVFLAKKPVALFFAYPKPFLLLGLFGVMEVGGHFMAIMLTQVSFMIAVKRLSLLFAIVYGAILFQEADFQKRFFAGCVMLAGVFLVTYGSQG